MKQMRLEELIIRSWKKELLSYSRNTDVDPISPKTKVKTLPLAQKQVLEILKALNRDGDIIIFDEATSALPDKLANWLMNIIRRLAAEQKSNYFYFTQTG